MFDGSVFLRKWDSGSLSVKRVVIAQLLGPTTLESFSEVIGRGVWIILRTVRQKDQIRCGVVEAGGVHEFLNKMDDDVCRFNAQTSNEICWTRGFEFIYSWTCLFGMDGTESQSLTLVSK